MNFPDCSVRPVLTPCQACRMCDERPAVIRGLCRRCRQGVRRDVAAGRVTETELIRAGLLLPGAKGRRRAAPPWRRKIEQMLTGGAIDANPLLDAPLGTGDRAPAP